MSMLSALLDSGRHPRSGRADGLDVIPVPVGREEGRGYGRRSGDLLSQGGDAIARGRMRGEVSETAAVSLSSGEAFEEGDHPLGSDAGGEEQVHPFAVRFLLRVAAILKLGEDPGALDAVR